MMSDLATQDNYDFGERVAGRDPAVPPTTREAISKYRAGPFSLLQDYYRPAPDDAWKKIDDAALARDIVPDTGMNLFAAGPQEAPQVAKAATGGVENVANWVIPQSPTDAALMFAMGPVGGKLAKTAVGAAGVMGELLDPAQSASLKGIRNSTSVLDFMKPGNTPEAWHRIANRKLDRPLDTIPVDWSGAMPPPSRVIDPSTLEGKFLMPLPGDPTSRGRVIHSIDDVRLSEPFTTHGGRTYIDAEQGFANAKPQATQAVDRVKRYQDQYDTDVVGAYLKMGPQSADFSSHTWAPLARMFAEAPMSERGKSALNASIRKELGGERFPGVDAPNLEQYLAGSKDSYRKAVINATEKARGEIKGVPDVVAIRYAATDPALLNVPTNAAGLSMTQLTGKTRPSTHPDYPVHLEGKDAFGLGQMLPREVMFPDFAAALDKRGLSENYWLRMMGQTPPREIPYGQLATPKWVDNTSRYMGDVADVGQEKAFQKYLLEHFGWK